MKNPWKEGLPLVFKGYQNRLGYKIPPSSADAKAITWMLKAGYTPNQILAAYDRLMAQPFWRGKHLPMQSIKNQIGALMKISAGTHEDRTGVLKRGWVLK